MSVDIHLIGYDYTNKEHKAVAIDPTTKAILVKDISPPPTDHGELTGLADDDHPHYYNQARGDARYLKLAGGTMTGLLTLSGVPTVNLHAATKKYVDDKPVGGRDKKNLVVKVNASYPAYQIDIDADILQVEDENLSSINLTVNIAASGANGLDTGSEAADTWYSIWVIRGTSGTAGLLSISATSPTMPAGYTKKRRVGWVRNDGSSNFLKFFQTGDWWHWDACHIVLDTGAASSSWADVNCGSYRPPTSELMIITGHSQDTNGRGANLWVRRKGSSWNGGMYYCIMQYSKTTDVNCEVGVAGIIVSCNSDGYIQYHVDVGDNIAHLSILGYYDPI